MHSKRAAADRADSDPQENIKSADRASAKTEKGSQTGRFGFLFYRYFSSPDLMRSRAKKSTGKKISRLKRPALILNLGFRVDTSDRSKEQ